MNLGVDFCQRSALLSRSSFPNIPIFPLDGLHRIGAGTRKPRAHPLLVRGALLPRALRTALEEEPARRHPCPPVRRLVRLHSARGRRDEQAAALPRRG